MLCRFPRLTSTYLKFGSNTFRASWMLLYEEGTLKTKSKESCVGVWNNMHPFWLISNFSWRYSTRRRRSLKRKVHENRLQRGVAFAVLNISLPFLYNKSYKLEIWQEYCPCVVIIRLRGGFTKINLKGELLGS